MSLVATIDCPTPIIANNNSPIANNITININNGCTVIDDCSELSSSISANSTKISTCSFTDRDLHGLKNDEDGDVLRAKCLNKLTTMEREHILQDIHGVANYVPTDIKMGGNNDDSSFVDSLLKKLRIELNNELKIRKKNKKKENTTNTNDANSNSNYVDNTMNGRVVGNSPSEQYHHHQQQQMLSTKQLHRAANEHFTHKKFNSFPFGRDIFDINSGSNNNENNYEGNAFKMDYPLRKTSAMSIPSELFSGSNINSSSSSNIINDGNSTATVIEDEEERDATILHPLSNATAYEQALAQCRERRREQSNSLFRLDELLYGRGGEGNQHQNENNDDKRYIDPESDEFLLSFLKCDRSPVSLLSSSSSSLLSRQQQLQRVQLQLLRKVARRILDYFEEKKSLFGLDLLTTNLMWKDLDHETKRCLESGCIQLLPVRDRAGRAIIVKTKKLIPSRNSSSNNNTIDEHDSSTLRAFWFLGSVALEDAETVTKGVVFVYYAIGGGDGSSPDYSVDERRRRRIGKWGKVLRSMPLQVASIHWCDETVQEKKAANLSALMLLGDKTCGGSSSLSSDLLARVRCHAGTDTEVRYSLMTFGIPTDLFPVRTNGTVDLSHNRDFLQQRKNLEARGIFRKAFSLLDESMIDDDFTPLDIAKEGDDDDIFPVIATPSINSKSSSDEDPVDTSTLFPALSSVCVDETNYQQRQQQLLPLPLEPQQSSHHGAAQHPPKQIQQHKQQELLQDILVSSNDNNNHGTENVVTDSTIPFHDNNMSLFTNSNNDSNSNNDRMNTSTNNAAVPSNSTIPNTKKKLKKERLSVEDFDRTPVEVPGELDILLGRGRGAQNHAGNVHYRHVVETFRKRYEQMNQKGSKTKLIRDVVAVIYDNGGRFLKQEGKSGRWIPIHPDVARDKVSHSFRNLKRLRTTLA